MKINPFFTPVDKPQEESMKKNTWFVQRVAVIFVFVMAMIISPSQSIYGEEDLTATLKAAEELFQKGEFDEAAELYEKCLHNINLVDSHKDVIYYRMGQCAEAKSKNDLAKYYYKQAMNYGYTVADSSASAVYAIADSEYQKLQDAYAAYNDTAYADVEKNVRQLLAEELHKRDSLEPLFLLGRTQVCLQQEDKARQSFKSVLKIDSNYEPFAATDAERKIYYDEKRKYNSRINRAKRLATNKWTWIGVGGAAVTGGFVYLFSRDGDEELPQPPNLPK
ncbi:MAG TPA: hypothetical protein PKN24_14335 [bacterium]|nr:hypothetical protein [bacterium]